MLKIELVVQSCFDNITRIHGKCIELFSTITFLNAVAWGPPDENGARATSSCPRHFDILQSRSSRRRKPPVLCC